MSRRLAAESDLAQVLEQLLRLFRQLASSGGLSFAAAAVLSRIVREGPQRLTDLADREAVSQPAMTQLVNRLEREGLLRRTPCADDRRAVLVDVTADGTAVVQRRRAERAAALRRMLDQLDPDDRSRIGAALPALARLVALSPSVQPGPARTRTGRGDHS